MERGGIEDIELDAARAGHAISIEQPAESSYARRMGKLVTCASCGGFTRGLVCPHCGRRGALVRVLGGAAAVVGSGAIAFTLMACYGMPPCPEGNRDCRKPPPPTSEGGASMPKASDPQDAPAAK